MGPSPRSFLPTVSLGLARRYRAAGVTAFAAALVALGSVGALLPPGAQRPPAAAQIAAADRPDPDGAFHFGFLEFDWEPGRVPGFGPWSGAAPGEAASAPPASSRPRESRDCGAWRACDGELVL